MDIMSSKEGDVLIVCPNGERVDASCATDFRNSIIALIEEGNPKIIIDLSKVDFIDSSGLGAMVTLRKKIGNGKLALFGVQDSVKTMFKLTRMDKVFSICDDVESAKSAIE